VAVTLAFLRLGKVAPPDAAGYVAAQFTGGFAGIVAATVLLGGLPSDAAVNYVATVPGSAGSTAAFAAEAAISFAMMAMVLAISNVPRWSRYTGCAAGALVALYNVFEAPVSGMSMNPARTLGSNVLADAVESLWIYFTAPVAGMLFAAEMFVRWRGPASIRCAKLHHTVGVRCIFRCGYTAASTEIAR
jgi:aquaporin Z